MLSLVFRSAGVPPALLLLLWWHRQSCLCSCSCLCGTATLGCALFLVRHPEHSEGSLFAFEAPHISNRTSRAQTNCGTSRRNKRNTNPRAFALSHAAPARSHAYSPAHSPEHFYPHFRPHLRHQTESPNPIPPAAT